MDDCAKSVVSSTARESILAERYSWILGTIKLGFFLATSVADLRNRSDPSGIRTVEGQRKSGRNKFQELWFTECASQVEYFTRTWPGNTRVPSSVTPGNSSKWTSRNR